MTGEPAALPCLGEIIPADFRGTIQSDGYAAYRTFAVDMAVVLSMGQSAFFDRCLIGAVSSAGS